MASLHRNTWVAGQRVYINVGIQNDTSKKINGMTLSLIRTVTLYKPRPELDLDGQAARRDLDPDACQTSTTRKKIAEEELEMGQKGSRGVVTARGWWTGVEPGQRVESSHYMQIPGDALSISRGRHVEVVYSIKVSIGSSLSSDVSVELPLRVINFVSLDPHLSGRQVTPSSALTQRVPGLLGKRFQRCQIPHQSEWQSHWWRCRSDGGTTQVSRCDAFAGQDRDLSA